MHLVTVLVTNTSSKIFPVLTETVRKDSVTESCLYCLEPTYT